jgi:hypothetical protein
MGGGEDEYEGNEYDEEGTGGFPGAIFFVLV